MFVVLFFIENLEVKMGRKLSKWLPKGSKMEPSAPLGRFGEGLGEAIWPEGRFWHGFGLHLGRHLGPSGGSGALLRAF